MQFNTRTVPFMGIATLLLTAGVGYASMNRLSLPVHAQTPLQQASGQVDQETADDAQQPANQAEQAPMYKSSLQIADSSEQSEQAEQQKLTALAKITPDQAKAAAEKVLGGTASEAQLENDGGNVVYAVTDGMKQAKVDAGNGQILHTETSDGEANDGSSAN